MDCQSAFEALSAQLDGELSTTEENELKAHLEECPDCRQRQARLGQLDSAIRHLPSPGLTPPAFVKPKTDLVVGLEQKRKPSKIPFWALTTAACLMFTVGLFAPHPQVPMRLYFQGDANLTQQRPAREVCLTRAFRSGPIHGELMAQVSTEFSLLLDAEDSQIEPVHLEIHYDFEGDGEVDRVEKYRPFAIDDRPGWQEYHHGLGLESAQGEMRPFRGGTVSALIASQSPVKVHQGASYIHVPHLVPEG